MSKTINAYVKKLNKLFETTGLNRAARRLLLLSDRQLVDAGISREKLYIGASAYPWKLEENNIQRVKFTKKAAVITPNDDKPMAA